MQPDHRILAVDVRPDDRVRAQLANACGSGWLACPLAPRPQGKRERTQAVCDALLAALGKSNQLGGSQRNTREQLREVLAWPLAKNVSQLFVLDGHYVNAGCWTTLIDVAVEADMGLAIGCDRRELRRGHKDLLNAYAIPWCDAEDLLAQMPSAAPAALPAAPAAPNAAWPPVPEAHFTMFAAELRDLSAPEQRHRAEAECTEAAALVHAWVDEHQPLDGEELSQFLRDLVAGVPWTTQAVIRLQAAQAALFMAGWSVEVDFQLFLANAEATVSLIPEVTARLERYINAALPAAAVLSLRTRRSAEALTAVTLSDLAEDGSTVVVEGRRYKIPEHARGILRAQLWQRLLEGASEDAPLFRARDSSSPETAAKGEQVQRLLETVTHRGGVRVTRPWSERRSRSSRETLRRIGVVIRPISPTGGMPWLRRV